MATKKRKKKAARINNMLLRILLVTVLVVIGAFGWNIYQISKNGSDTSTKATDKIKSEYSNKYYTIENDPISLDKKYFKELNTAVKSGDKTEISSDLVKCFVTEYYTWKNKTGTYDIGGIQYIFTDRQSDFASYTRNGYYADMDLYLSQLGASKLMQVSDVQITGATLADDMTVLNTNGEEVTYPCITVTATWTYDAGSMDLSEAQTSGTFQVIDHDGRMEIASIQ